MAVASALLLGLVGVWRHDDAVLAAGANPVTPGNFTGYGFDACQTPSQKTMDAWLSKSPFLAIGVYISGTNRACATQPNLTATWVSTQLANGWKLLPITVGPQALCYGGSKPLRIPAASANNYSAARQQATATAQQAVADAQALGIVRGSTLYYDLEAFSMTKSASCKNPTAQTQSTLRFLGAWTDALHAAGYKSGVYGSVGSSLKILDSTRINHPNMITLPDQIWLARYDNLADLSAPDYISEEGWQPHARIKQYRGGCLTYASNGTCSKYNSPTYGGASMNIDTDYMSVGKGSIAGHVTYCGGVTVNFATYSQVSKPKSGHPMNATQKSLVRALKCLLNTRGTVTVSSANANWGTALPAAMNNWQVTHGLKITSAWTRADWVSLLSSGTTAPIYKYGSASERVRDLQRALNAATPGLGLPITGTFFDQTQAALKAYQGLIGQSKDGITDAALWAAMAKGAVAPLPPAPPVCTTPSPTPSLTASASPSASATASPTPCVTPSPTATVTVTTSATATTPARK